MRLSVVEGMFAMPLCFLSMPGNFLMASLATKALGLQESVYGIIASLPAWSNVVQLFALPWLARRYSQKAICLSFSWIHLACWSVVGWAMPRLAEGGAWHSPSLVLALFAAGSVAFAMVNVSWTSWVQEWLPNRSRGKYLGRRNRLLQISTVAFLVAASYALAVWKGHETLGFRVIIFGGVAMRAVSIVLQQWILPTRQGPDERRASAWAQMAGIRNNTPLLRFVGFGAAFGFAANFMGPFFPVFFYKALGMSVEEVGRLVIVSTVTGAISMPFWGSICDRFGCRPSLLIALGAWMLAGYGYFFVTRDRQWPLFVIWGCGGAAGAGFLFGTFSMTLKLIPVHAKTTAISFNLAATSLAAAIAPILGGYLFEWTDRAFSDRVAVFHVMSGIHHTVTLSTGLLLLGVAEPRSTSLTQAIGSMRSMRELGALLGVSFLVNYSFFRRSGSKGEAADGRDG